MFFILFLHIIIKNKYSYRENVRLFYAYILKCFNSDQTFIYYRGSTNNLERRLRSHRRQYNKYTKRFKGNIELIYFEKFDTKSQAYKRELELKDMSKKLIKTLSLKNKNMIMSNFLFSSKKIKQKLN